jgi:hypothetical protein
VHLAQNRIHIKKVPRSGDLKLREFNLLFFIIYLMSQA